MTTAPDEPRIVKAGDDRIAIYDVLIALGPILVAAGFMSPEDVQRWLTLAAAIIPPAGLVLARLNTPKGRRAK